MFRVKIQSPNLLVGITISVTLLLACSLFVIHAAGEAPGLNAKQTVSSGSPAQRLAQGQSAERELKGGEKHTHVINLRRGEFLRVLVDQRGINVIVTLRSRAGAKLAEVDLLPEVGPEPVSFEATEGGDYLLEVRAAVATAPGGRYGVTATVKAGATAEDRVRVAAERLLAGAAELYRAGGVAAMRRAEVKSQRGLALLGRLNDKYWMAYSLNKLGLISVRLDQKEKTPDFYSQALSLRRSIGDRQGEAATLANIGYFHESAGRKEQAKEFLLQALTHQREIGDRFNEAAMHNNIGILYGELAEHQKALDSFREALAIFKNLGARLGEADALYNLG